MITRREIESERFAYATLELYHRIVDCFEGYALKEKIGELRAGYYDEIKIRTKEERDFIKVTILKLENFSSKIQNRSSAGTVDYTNGENIRPANCKMEKVNLNEVGSYEPLGSR